VCVCVCVCVFVCVCMCVDAHLVQRSHVRRQATMHAQHTPIYDCLQWRAVSDGGFFYMKGSRANLNDCGRLCCTQTRLASRTDSVK